MPDRLNWTEFYTASRDWSPSYICKRAAGLTSYGPPGEVCDVAHDIADYSHAQASSFLCKAIDAGIRLPSSQILELANTLLGEDLASGLKFLKKLATLIKTEPELGETLVSILDNWVDYEPGRLDSFAIDLIGMIPSAEPARVLKIAKSLFCNDTEIGARFLSKAIHKLDGPWPDEFFALILDNIGHDSDESLLRSFYKMVDQGAYPDEAMYRSLVHGFMDVDPALGMRILSWGTDMGLFINGEEGCRILQELSEEEAEKAYKIFSQTLRAGVEWSPDELRRITMSFAEANEECGSKALKRVQKLGVFFSTTDLLTLIGHLCGTCDPFLEQMAITALKGDQSFTADQLVELAENVNKPTKELWMAIISRVNDEKQGYSEAEHDKVMDTLSGQGPELFKLVLKNDRSIITQMPNTTSDELVENMISDDSDLAVEICQTSMKNGRSLSGAILCELVYELLEKKPGKALKLMTQGLASGMRFDTNELTDLADQFYGTDKGYFFIRFLRTAIKMRAIASPGLTSGQITEIIGYYPEVEDEEVAGLLLTCHEKGLALKPADLTALCSEGRSMAVGLYLCATKRRLTFNQLREIEDDVPKKHFLKLADLSGIDVRHNSFFSACEHDPDDEDDDEF